MPLELANPLRPMNLKARVFSGSGRGSEFIGLPWVKKQIEDKLGFTPFSGTLNLRLVETELAKKKRILNSGTIKISSDDGLGQGRCLRATLEHEVECAIVIPVVRDYPMDVLEIIADTSLRDRLDLKDGDMVEVEVLLSSYGLNPDI